MSVGYFLFKTPIHISKLGDWSFISEDFDEVIGYTNFGDFFLINKKTDQCAVLYVMPPELADLEFYGIEQFKNEFLTHETVKEDLLQVEKIEKIEKNIGNLNEGEVYIPEPYPFLGGNCSVETYSKGDLWTFIDIVGQMQEINSRKL